jgi:hypothetical protein
MEKYEKDIERYERMAEKEKRDHTSEGQNQKINWE